MPEEFFESDFALESPETTTNTLLKLARDFFKERAPKSESEPFPTAGEFDEQIHLEFLMCVAENFKVMLPGETAHNLRTVSAVTTLLYEGELPGLVAGESCFYSLTDRPERDDL